MDLGVCSKTGSSGDVSCLTLPNWSHTKVEKFIKHYRAKNEIQIMPKLEKTKKKTKRNLWEECQLGVQVMCMRQWQTLKKTASFIG